VRYAVKTNTTVNIGSSAKIFEVANTGNTPCAGQSPCSPDGKWKAASSSLALDAGEGQEFQNVRVSCIAGPCPFTKIDSDGFSNGGRKIAATVRAWSDTVTFLVEAEVIHTTLTDSSGSIPSIFGRTCRATLPPGSGVRASGGRQWTANRLSTGSGLRHHWRRGVSRVPANGANFTAASRAWVSIPMSPLESGRMRSSVYCCAAALLAGAILLAQTQTNVENRVESLLARMTIDDKIGQMSQSTAMATPISDGIKAEIRAGRWGSFLNAGSPADRAEAQRIAMTESRLHIPLIFGRDVIHGYKTIFPIPLAQAATWDPEVVEHASRQAANEAAAEGIRWTFAPMIDIARDPRWGRIAESLGEDPRLTSAMAAAMVRGFQGASLNDASALAACAKHFAGYGAAEAGRDYNSAWIPEILLREVYLPPFLAARDAGVATFMTSFNTLNGVPATGNRFLLREILRSQWKYDGMVVSDYEAVTEMIRHGYARDAREAARKAVGAGVDMEMVSTAYFAHLKSLLQSGEVSIAEIDSAVRNILRLKFRLGLFDQSIPAAAEVVPTAQSLALAERAATEGAVLLKNERGLLPLAEARLLRLGPLADSPVDQMGAWAWMAGRLVCKRRSWRFEVTGQRTRPICGLRNSRDLDREGSLRQATAADVVLLFLEEQILRRRGRAFLNAGRRKLVNTLSARTKPLVTVIAAGRPHISRCGRGVGAVLYASIRVPWVDRRQICCWDKPCPRAGFPSPLRTVGQIPIYYAHLNRGVRIGAGWACRWNPGNRPVTLQIHRCRFYAEYIRLRLTYTTWEYSNVRVSRLCSGQAVVTLSARWRTVEAVKPGDRQLYLQSRGNCSSASAKANQLPAGVAETRRAPDRRIQHFGRGPCVLRRTHETGQSTGPNTGLHRA
jgi:beta-glucosidase